jgi:hypothetical protein
MVKFVFFCKERVFTPRECLVFLNWFDMILFALFTIAGIVQIFFLPKHATIVGFILLGFATFLFLALILLKILYDYLESKSSFYNLMSAWMIYRTVLLIAYAILHALLIVMDIIKIFKVSRTE